MNALNVSVDRVSQAASHLVRRIPLTVRTLELLAVIALYVGGLVFVDQLAGKAHFPVVVYAMFLMPVVLSVGLRWVRTIERRLGHDIPHLG